MSGSGPTMYAIYASDADARDAEPRIATRGARTWLTHTLAGPLTDEPITSTPNE
jgi:4-diphosphocytidyl-2C-methyl-D-erythritol kinase